MSEGHNRRFKGDPRGYLGRHLIHTTRMEQAGAMDLVNAQDNPNLVEFDLRPVNGEVQLVPYYLRGKMVSRHTHLIRAYWLPWASRATAELVIGGAANYFFTSQLSGCQMRFVSAPGGVRMLHIAGDRGGPGWRDEQAQELLGNRYNRSQRWSSTQEYPHAETVNFIGVRGFFGWRFYSQTVYLADNFAGQLPPRVVRVH